MSAAHVIETAAVGIVVPAPAAIAAPRRSLPVSPVTSTAAPVLRTPSVPSPHVIVVVGSSPHDAVVAMTTRNKIPLMCAQRTHSPPKLHQKMIGSDACQKLARQSRDP